MKVIINTLTPLWTGGVKSGAVDRVHETGIIGSLRWWFEALMRGMGGHVCDVGKRCIYNAEESKTGLCDVCKLFGATGWRRRFRLVIDDDTQPEDIADRVVANREYSCSKGRQRTPTWFFPKNLRDKPRTGNLIITIQGTASDFQPAIIGGLLQFMADWAAIGARAQMGFGVFELDHSFDTGALYKFLVSHSGDYTNNTLPSLQNIFLARIRLTNAVVQDIFNLKYDIRRLFSGQINTELRHFLMGTTKKQRIAAKVKISRPYADGLIRVWGWIPEEADVYSDSWNREKVVEEIYHHLDGNYTLDYWREMNPLRDTVTPNVSSAENFLRSLMGLEEEDDEA